MRQSIKEDLKDKVDEVQKDKAEKNSDEESKSDVNPLIKDDPKDKVDEALNVEAECEMDKKPTTKVVRFLDQGQ